MLKGAAGALLAGLVGAALGLGVLAGFHVVFGQGPQAPVPCEEQLNNEMFQAGGLKQELAIARARLSAMTKERDEAKAALATFLTPKAPEPEKK